MGIGIGELKSMLERYRKSNVSIASHSIGDADFIGSAIALAEYIPNSKIIVQDKISANVERILKQNGILLKTDSSLGNPDLIILLDVNNFQNCGTLQTELSKTKKSILIIDHHHPKAEERENVITFDQEEYSSTCNIVYSVLKELGFKLTQKSAEMLLIGMVSDSAELINSTPKTFMHVSEILDYTKTDYADIVEEISYNLNSKEREEIISDICSSSKENISGILILYGESKLPAHISADFAVKAGADIALFYSYYKEEISISARMRHSTEKKRKIHLGEIMGKCAHAINGTGGGHSCAAGAYGPKKEGYKDFVKEFKEMVSATAAVL